MEDNTKTIPEITREIQEENRKPGTWLPGQSGNPNGRPKKGHSITETIKAMMDERPEIKKALAAKVLQMASEGDITAMKTIWNYLDGMPMQKSDLRVTQLPTPLLGEQDVQENNSAEQVKKTE